METPIETTQELTTEIEATTCPIEANQAAALIGVAVVGVVVCVVVMKATDKVKAAKNDWLRSPKWRKETPVKETETEVVE